jgi:D-beta-D-heptose 7-phosphate kinase/D-beta-D-heptose 1-phosphate adenosyltransferase
MGFPPTVRKVVSLEEAVARAAEWRARGKRIVYTNGCFDLLHAGHVRTLEAARGLAEALVVGINSDDSTRRLKGPGRPVVPEQARAEMLAALEAVDLVVIFPETTSMRVIEALRPEVWAKGGDYTLATVNQEEKAFVESYGGQVAVVAHVPGVSTTDIVARVKAL